MVDLLDVPLTRAQGWANPVGTLERNIERAQAYPTAQGNYGWQAQCRQAGHTCKHVLRGKLCCASNSAAKRCVVN